MALMTTSAELFREIKRRGLHLRAGNGRDDAIYAKLARALGCRQKSLQQFLDRGSVPIERFVETFFGLAAPFARMYADIFKSLETFNVRSPEESIQMTFDFGRLRKGRLDFDLRQFREAIETYRRFEGLRRKRLWRYEDLQRLFEFFRKLRNDIPAPWPSYYLPTKPYDLEAVPPVRPRLMRALEAIHALFGAIVQRSALGEAPKPISDRRDASLSLLRGDAPVEAVSTEENVPRLAQLLTDLMPAFGRLLMQLRVAGAEETIGDERIEDAISYFENEILPHVGTREEQEQGLVREVLDVLNLPLWKYRWHLYEIWATFAVLKALGPFNVSVHHENGRINLTDTKACRFATLEAADGRHMTAWLQRETRVTGWIGRRGIKPDLRLNLEDPQRADGTVTIVEFKQRKQMSRPELVRLVDLYDHGAKESVANFFLNYDTFPDVAPASFASPTKSILLSDFQPLNDDALPRMSKALLERLELAGLKPRDQVDAILIDVSGSMKEIYADGAVFARLTALVRRHTAAKVYYFDADLIDPSDLKDLSDLNRHLHGATKLEAALRTLRGRLPEAKRLLVLTDGDYGAVPSLSSYASEEVHPRALQVDGDYDQGA